MNTINTFQSFSEPVQRSFLSSRFDNAYTIYLNEEACTEAFKQFRIYKGFSCKKCQSKDYYWLAAKEQFQCKKCKFRTTLRSGTVYENCKLPFSYLFITCHLLLKTGSKTSAEDLQRITGHKYFEPLWVLMRKIKEELNKDDQLLLLLLFIETTPNVPDKDSVFNNSPSF